MSENHFGNVHGAAFSSPLAKSIGNTTASLPALLQLKGREYDRLRGPVPKYHTVRFAKWSRNRTSGACTRCKKPLYNL